MIHENLCELNSVNQPKSNMTDILSVLLYQNVIKSENKSNSKEDKDTLLKVKGTRNF